METKNEQMNSELVIQIVLGSRLFELPILQKFKYFWYRNHFNAKDLKIGYDVNIVKSHPNPDSKIIIEKNVTVCKNCFIDYSGGLEIGSNCMFSQGTKIFTHEHKLGNKLEFSKLVIGDNAWLGTNVIILPSVSKIGDNAVIGAGSVVTKNIPENTVFAGNPAKIIKRL